MMKIRDTATLFTDGDWIESKDQAPNGIRLLQTGNIGMGDFIDKEGKEKYITEETFQRLNCTEVLPGDILISRLPDPVGRACVVPDLKTKMITAVDCTIYRVNDSKINKYYVNYFLMSGMYFRNLSLSINGATRKRISRKNLEKVGISIPSMETQQHVVNVLDRVRTLISLHRKEISFLDELVKARFVEMFGDPVHNENNWRMDKLDDACSAIVDCPHSTPAYTNVDTGYMCIRTSIVKKNRILWDKIEYVSKDEYEKRIQRKKPSLNDVVYTREGGILGIAAVIDRDCDVALGQRMMLLTPDTNKINPIFLSTVMNMESFLNKAMQGVSGSASPHINVGDIKQFPIIMPPVEQQNQFADFAEQVEASKAVVQRSLTETQTLFDSLMQQYFG